ncbi:MAG: hypothetical protein V3U90_03280, partial [Dehalococcoidia bacterium]
MGILSAFRRRVDSSVTVSAVTYYEKGSAYSANKDIYRAIDQFTLAIRHDNKLTDAYIKRGEAFSITGDYDKAIEDYERARY